MYCFLHMFYSTKRSKCRSLHGRYLATPWLASPHLQTLFLGISGRPPSFTYKRQLYTVRDGGTVALDWLLANLEDGIISQDASTPLVVVVPGLTSDSDAAYVKHLVHSMARKGWNVVVSNHRGLGGVSITSDYFYNGGWTEDVREIVNYLHQKYPEAPMFCVGTSIGANILVHSVNPNFPSIFATAIDYLVMLLSLLTPLSLEIVVTVT